MKFAVDAWAVEYGTPVEEAMALAAPGSAPVLDIEMPVDEWAPRRPSGVAAASGLVFTDGVRRVDARVWIDIGDGRAAPGLCASYAAGIVKTQPGERAAVVTIDVARGLFTGAPTAEAIATRAGVFPARAAAGDAPELIIAVQQRMAELEVELAGRVGDAELVVIDGPLRGRQHLANAIGYIKTHHVAYLPPALEGVVGALAVAERTPVFLTTTTWSRYSWYVRLPGVVNHPWAAVVRCEASADLEPAAAIALADVATVTLPRFASEAHKDSRAPHNLYPIAGLERTLRHRLGDPALIYRSLCAAAG